MRNNLSDGSFKAKILIERQLLLIYCMNNNDSQSFYSIVISLFIKPELRNVSIINNILSLLLKYFSSNICNLFNFFSLKVMKQLSLWSWTKFKYYILLFFMSHQVQCLHRITIMLISGKYLRTETALPNINSNKLNIK